MGTCLEMVTIPYQQNSNVISKLVCSLVEETESHVVIFLLRLWLRSLGCSSFSWSSCGSYRSGSSKLARISKELLQHLSLLEGDVGHSSNSQQVLHTVDHAVRDRGNGGVGDGQGQSGYLSNS